MWGGFQDCYRPAQACQAADHDLTGGTIPECFFGIEAGSTAATVFEAATLVAAAGGLILDDAFKIPARDVAGFTVEVVRAEAEALIAPAPPAGA